MDETYEVDAPRDHIRFNTRPVAPAPIAAAPKNPVKAKKVAPIWLTCSACSFLSDKPYVSVAPHRSGTGYHIRASCPACGAYIKFLPKTIFSTAQIVDLHAKSGVKMMIGDANDSSNA